MNSPYPEVTIGSLASPEKGAFKIGPFGSSLKKAELVEDGIPVVGIENILPNKFSPPFRKFITSEKFEQLSQYKIEPFDILVTTMGTIGRSAIAPQNVETAIIDSHLFRMRVDRKRVDPAYLSYALNGYTPLKKQLEDKSVGAIMAGLNTTILRECTIPLPPLNEQMRIVNWLTEKLTAVESASQAVDVQLNLLTKLVNSYFRESLQRKTVKMHLSDCMVEVKKGIGETWAQYPVLGATRAGVAPAKEKVGKQPQRYKLVEPGTIFYNPMRIMIGSIAMLDDGDESGITSPDYVVLKGKEGILHPRWFYYWFRSPYGENFIKSLARGAVRERMLFNRLDKGEIELPDWETQVKIAEKLKEIKAFRQALESQLAEINELPSALLRQAFAGEL